jgi:hypothetical protein
MKTTKIPRAEFDWGKFVSAVTEFAQSLTLGSVEPFVVVEHGQLILDLEDLTLADGEEAEDIPTDPIERLEAGFALFAPFAAFCDFGELACADGDVIEVPDLYEADLDEDEDDEDAPRLTAKQRELIEATVCDENHFYGFQIALDGASLVFRSVLVGESDGECDVEAAEDGGLVDKPMAKFLKGFSKRSRKARKYFLA